MRKSKTIKIDDCSFVINELTAGQVEECLKLVDQERPAYIAELLIDSPVTIEAVSMSSGVAVDDLNGKYAPSELQQIWEAVSEVNDFLYRLLARMVAAGAPAAKTCAEPSAG